MKIKRSINLFTSSLGKYWRAKHLDLPPFYLRAGNKLRQINAPLSVGSACVYVEIIGDDVNQSKLWLPLMPPKAIVLDVGGNYGLFSCWIKTRFPDSLVTVLEPHPDVLPFLSSNASTFDFRVIPKAVSPNGSPVLIDLSGDSTTSYVLDGFSSADSSSESATAKVESVSWKQLFNYFPNTIDLLKCDCEGGEEGLLGDLDLLTRSRVIAMEYHFSHVEEAWIMSQLKHAGFKILSNTIGPYSGHLVALQGN